MMQNSPIPRPGGSPARNKLSRRDTRNLNSPTTAPVSLSYHNSFIMVSLIFVNCG